MRTFPNSIRGLPEMPMNEGYGKFRKYVNYFSRFVADTVESNFMSCYLNIVEDDEYVSSTFDVNISSNEGDHTISNEGDNIISNEGANKKTDCYVGGVFKHSTGVGPPTRVRVLHTIESDDVVQSYRVTDEEGN